MMLTRHLDHRPRHLKDAGLEIKFEGSSPIASQNRSPLDTSSVENT
jgi:hypothetical protein